MATKMTSYMMNFGKYTNCPIQDVPRSYLNWCQEKIEDGEFKFMSEEEKKEFEEATEIELQIRDRSHITF